MLAAALRQVAEAAAEACDPWWIIGSAAVSLHGVATTVADIDLLMSERDAVSFLARYGVAPGPGMPGGRFRSQVFGRVDREGVKVEVMAGLAVFDGRAWTTIHPSSRVREGGVFVPNRDELIAILHRFGRRKDVERAALLAPGGGGPARAEASSSSPGP